MGTKRRCKDCERLSDLLYAANEREGKRIKESAALSNRLQELSDEVVRLSTRLLDAEARAQVRP